MSKTTHPANVVPLTESEQFVHIYVNTFAQFSPTCAGSYCQRTPHKKYRATNETQILILY